LRRETRATRPVAWDGQVDAVVRLASVSSMERLNGKACGRGQIEERENGVSKVVMIGSRLLLWGEGMGGNMKLAPRYLFPNACKSCVEKEREGEMSRKNKKA